jgi:ureidoacrylate peracid hydrolase
MRLRRWGGPRSKMSQSPRISRPPHPSTVRIPTPLVPIAEKLDPRRSALIVVDVQNDFCSPGGALDREKQDLSMVQEMLPKLKGLVDVARDAKVRIIWVRSAYGMDGNPYLSPVFLDRAARSMGGAHIKYRLCEPGTWGAELCDGLGIRDAELEATVTKHRYSAFFQTELELMLRAMRIETVAFAGVSTNVCVETSARDAFMRDFFVVLVADCCAGYSEEEQHSTLSNIRKYFGQVLSSSELAALWLDGNNGARGTGNSEASAGQNASATAAGKGHSGTTVE